MSLPYYNSKTQPHLAKARITKLLQKFGVSQVNMSEDFDNNEIRVSFIFQKMQVSIPVNYEKLASAYYPNYRWDNVHETHQKQCVNAAWASIEDYLKAMLMMHELGIMDLAEIFLPNIVTKSGMRVAEMIHGKLPEFLSIKLLGDGK